MFGDRMNGYKRESGQTPALKVLLVREENEGVNSHVRGE